MYLNPLASSAELLRPLRETFENIAEKKRNAGNQLFLFFQQCFLSLTLSKTTIFRLFQTERVCKPQLQIG